VYSNVSQSSGPDQGTTSLTNPAAPCSAFPGASISTIHPTVNLGSLICIFKSALNRPPNLSRYLIRSMPGPSTGRHKSSPLSSRFARALSPFSAYADHHQKLGSTPWERCLTAACLRNVRARAWFLRRGRVLGDDEALSDILHQGRHFLSLTVRKPLAGGSVRESGQWASRAGLSESARE
jgi:hypothetical protein